jgi:hypothetical protein
VRNIFVGVGLVAVGISGLGWNSSGPTEKEAMDIGIAWLDLIYFSPRPFILLVLTLFPTKSNNISFIVLYSLRPFTLLRSIEFVLYTI